MFAPLLRAHVYSDLQTLSHKLMTNQLLKVRDDEPSPVPAHRMGWRLVMPLLPSLSPVSRAAFATTAVLNQAARKKNSAVEHILRGVRGLIAEWSTATAEDEVCAVSSLTRSALTGITGHRRVIACF